MHYAKYIAPELDDCFTDEKTGLTYYPDGSIEDLTGAIFYPGDDLFDAYTFDHLLSAETLAEKL